MNVTNQILYMLWCIDVAVTLLLYMVDATLVFVCFDGFFMTATNLLG